MKVVCIHNKAKFKNHPSNKLLYKLKVGEIYTVERVVDEGDGDIAYVLKEVKSNSWCGGWNSEKFREVDYSFGEKVCEEISKKQLVNVC